MFKIRTNHLHHFNKKEEIGMVANMLEAQSDNLI
jgi:hypothetical protein